MAEEKISPEEKLLKVIQGEGELSAEDAAAEKVVAAAPVAVEPAKAKPKLKVVKKDPETSSTGNEGLDEPSKQSSDASSKGDVGLIGVQTVAPAKKNEDAKSGLSLMNYALASAISMILFFTGLEIWGSVQQIANDDISWDVKRRQTGEDEGSTEADVSKGNESKLYEVTELKSAFEKMPIIKIPGMGPIIEGPKDVKLKPANWQKYVKENLRLLGLSKVNNDMEAIVSDRNKMYYLRVGQEMVIEKITIKVKRLGGGGVELTDGIKTISVK
ncbi:MAG: hypothetical protein KAH23_04250 [Kiritimatiellae bacterium]|nr:hypothetical protein [Kiritimatiellia bacterium]